MQGLIIILIICLSSPAFASPDAYNATSPNECVPGMEWNSSINKCDWIGGKRPPTKQELREAEIYRRAYQDGASESYVPPIPNYDSGRPSRKSGIGIGYDINTGKVGPMYQLFK